jgi:hypothetical protein
VPGRRRGSARGRTRLSGDRERSAFITRRCTGARARVWARWGIRRPNRDFWRPLPGPGLWWGQEPKPPCQPTTAAMSSVLVSVGGYGLSPAPVTASRRCTEENHPFSPTHCLRLAQPYLACANGRLPATARGGPRGGRPTLNAARRRSVRVGRRQRRRQTRTPPPCPIGSWRGTGSARR